MPFLEIVTRHLATRPNMLAANQASIEAQTDADWVQTLLIDEVGRGVPWANVNLGRYAPRLEGKYIWVLDDDDVCMCDKLVADVKAIVREHDPDVVMMRADHDRLGILPSARNWKRYPVKTGIGMSNFIVRRAVWQRHAPAAFTAELCADYRLISAIFDAGHSIHWWDRVVMRCQRQNSLGRPE